MPAKLWAGIRPAHRGPHHPTRSRGALFRVVEEVRCALVQGAEEVRCALVQGAEEGDDDEYTVAFPILPFHTTAFPIGRAARGGRWAAARGTLLFPVTDEYTAAFPILPFHTTAFPIGRATRGGRWAAARGTLLFPVTNAPVLTLPHLGTHSRSCATAIRLW